jgi:hypothetical protein
MDKKNLILIGVIVLLAGIFYISKNKSHSYNQAAKKSGINMVELSPGTVDSIRITKSKTPLHLIQKDNVWLVQEKNSYPADEKKIADLINRLRELKGDTFYSSDKTKWGNFQVLDPSESATEESGTKVELLNKKGEATVSIIIGKVKESKENNENAYAPPRKSIFARKTNSNDVYLCNVIVTIDNAPSNWIDKDLIDIKKNKIRSIEIKNNDKKPVAIVKTKPSDTPLLQNILETHKPNNSAIDSVLRAAESIRIESILTNDEIKDYKFIHSYTVKDFEGLIFEFSFTEAIPDKSSQHCMQIKMLVDEDYLKQESKPEENTKEGFTKLTIEQANKQAKEFNDKYHKWNYLLASWVAKRFLKDMEELSEPIKKDTPVVPENKEGNKEGENEVIQNEEQPEIGEQISCSHILIAYKGANNATATRTKEDAKKLAEDLLKKCKEENADFAAIAKENSDDGSKANGGDLGAFGKGAMVKPFEEAAFALKPNDISGLVESPFGFHIIKRTK